MNPLDFIKFTPKSNCGECGHPTCLAFAVAVTKGGGDPAACPHLDPAAPADIGQSAAEGAGLEKVSRGQNDRDMALVQHLKERLRGFDLRNVAPRLGAEWNAGPPEQLHFIYLGRSVCLDSRNLLISGVDAPDPRDQILLYNYVFMGGGEAPGHEWVGLESLPNSISKVRTLEAYCEQPLARRFSGRSSQLAEICRQLGSFTDPGEQNATVAAVVPVLPRVPHYLLFWDQEPEDGFTSRVKILFESRVLDFLDIESLVFSAERTAERIMELDS